MTNNMKQETLEEAAKEFVLSHDFSKLTNPNHLANRCFQFGAKWQQERMYSEEEVFELLLKHQSDYRSAVRNTSPLDWSFDIKEWFNQFKKK